MLVGTLRSKKKSPPPPKKKPPPNFSEELDRVSASQRSASPTTDEPSTVCTAADESVRRDGAASPVAAATEIEVPGWCIVNEASGDATIAAESNATVGGKRKAEALTADELAANVKDGVRLSTKNKYIT